MKKIISILTALILVFTAILFLNCDIAYADGVVEIHFVNPCDVFTYDSHVYVLDKVDDSNSILHRFDYSGADRVSYSISGAYDKIYIDNDVVYLLTADRVSWGTLSGNQYNQTGSFTDANTINAKDFTYSSLCGIICLGESSVYVIQDNERINTRFDNDTVVSCVKQGTSLFVLTNLIVREFVIRNSGISDAENDRVLSSIPSLSGKTLQKALTFTLGTATYNCVSDLNYVFELNGNTLFGLLPSNSTNSIKSFAVDAINSTTLAVFEIQNDNKLYRYTYTKNSESFVLSESDRFVIGSDTIVQAAPSVSSINSFVLATSTGYPTNYIYKIGNDANSITEAVSLTHDEIFVILNYDGSNTSKYYYVLYGDKFGYIEKASGTDTKINSINTSVTSTAKSNAAHLYSFPTIQDQYKIIGLPRDTDISIANIFEFNGETWYYVNCSYQDTEYNGFVRATTVYNLTGGNYTANVITKRANPAIGQQVAMYADIAFVLPSIDVEGNDIMLPVGTRVNVIKTENGISYVQVEKDGNYYFGYVDDSLLIQHGMTNYLALGLSLLIVAAALTIYLIIMIKRRKAHLLQIESEAELGDTSLGEKTETSTDDITKSNKDK